MTPYKEIGECLITVGEYEYFFRPSFAAMSRIGEPQEIVQTFADLHNDELTPLIERATAAYGHLPAWLIDHIRSCSYGKRALMAAMTVMQACCEVDLSDLIGELRPARAKGRAFKRRMGLMGDFEMLLIAQSLITHGIIGKAKVRQLQRHESGKATTEFNAFDYVSAARNHFSMTRSEAEQLTMTEFQHMLAAKYPDQKGFTREEYDHVADDYLAKKAKRLAKAS
ncbi:hypothetical protein GQQ15_06495 [Pantoea agglomerans]|uniref:DUF6246 family protein n=1 Tax=Enterobacter agglomerans TaxID=549 RepID=UPI0013BC4F2C|nr:DUF6246 family protein [Pantoea agglomerans]NEG85111.1 hypothetical protein [Pantoea agglomerans]NEH07058.1 hypothetical protein [Pantoea agglomerans]